MWGADAVLNYRLLPPNVLGCEILISGLLVSLAKHFSLGSKSVIAEEGWIGLQFPLSCITQDGGLNTKICFADKD